MDFAILTYDSENKRNQKDKQKELLETKLLVLDRNTCNHTTAGQLFVLDNNNNNRYHVNLCKNDFQ